MNDCKSDREKLAETIMKKLHRDTSRDHDKEIIRKINSTAKEKENK